MTSVAEPALTLRFKKTKDGPVTLTLVRPDGTTSSSRIGPAKGFGPVHDLAHYVVETRLGLERGFLGLVASGWQISDFETAGASRQMGAQAACAEALAGQLSQEAIGGQSLELETFNEAVAHGAAPVAVEPLEAAELDALRQELAELKARWLALAPGETMVLAFGKGPARHTAMSSE